ncbi:unnamed protein product [Prorocentrum cordatum]|uniref:C3H1-type domain-containing protein n=1 Tax=Prorocentrum cordatum TaxID=2364126 RepID=A0ABN9SZL7_9DINO|nr:unnamed protein product [Polarella glacialis]
MAPAGLRQAANVCRKFKLGSCEKGADCPLSHAIEYDGAGFSCEQSAPSELSQARARSQASGDAASDASSLSWTSSSDSRSWPSEQLWGGLSRIWTSAPAATELPAFCNRLVIPEFIPGASAASGATAKNEPCADSDGEAQQGPKSKSAARRRQRTTMEKWTEMKARNSSTSLHVVEAVCRFSFYAPLPQTRRQPRTESASPGRPPAPPPSPRKHKQTVEQDPDDSGHEGAAFQRTKVSL